MTHTARPPIHVVATFFLSLATREEFFFSNFCFSFLYTTAHPCHTQSLPMNHAKEGSPLAHVVRMALWIISLFQWYVSPEILTIPDTLKLSMAQCSSI